MRHEPTSNLGASRFPYTLARNSLGVRNASTVVRFLPGTPSLCLSLHLSLQLQLTPRPACCMSKCAFLEASMAPSSSTIPPSPPLSNRRSASSRS